MTLTIVTKVCEKPRDALEKVFEKRWRRLSWYTYEYTEGHMVIWGETETSVLLHCAPQRLKYYKDKTKPAKVPAITTIVVFMQLSFHP
jgi:hypothetical protein